MTYRGSLPGSGYNAQNGQPWQQQMMQNGFDAGTAYGNAPYQQQQQQQHRQPYPTQQQPQHQQQQPPSQYAQYHNPGFMPVGVGYPQPQRQQQQQQQQQPQQQQQQQQPQQPQHRQMANANFSAVHANQYHNYDAAFDQRASQSQHLNNQTMPNYGSQVGPVHGFAQQQQQQQQQQQMLAQQSRNSYSQQAQHNHIQQQYQQAHQQQVRQLSNHHLHQQAPQPQQQHAMTWQQMPPPQPAPSPTPSYQPSPQPQHQQYPTPNIPRPPSAQRTPTVQHTPIVHQAPNTQHTPTVQPAPVLPQTPSAQQAPGVPQTPNIPSILNLQHTPNVHQTPNVQKTPNALHTPKAQPAVVQQTPQQAHATPQSQQHQHQHQQTPQAQRQQPQHTPQPAHAVLQQQPAQLPQQQAPSRVNSPHINSPVMAQSPHHPQQLAQNPSSRNASVSAASARLEHAARVSASPRPATQGLTRSPSVSSTRSAAPAPGLVPHHPDTPSLLVLVAEEMFQKARSGVLQVADSPSSEMVGEYHKLIATGLGCLETALGSNRLAPRVEARLQLRYANILCEETTNIMEAETALTKGIALCDKYRFTDLKYLMQFLQLRMLSQRRGKAAMKALETHISDATLQKHTYWVYALRFFKASLYLESSNSSDVHALENLKAITEMALQRGDYIIFILASLLEGLSLLKHMKDDSIMRIQGCIAQCQKYQLDEVPRVPQVDVLLHMLDFACSLHQKSPVIITQKLKILQNHIDASLGNNQWSLSDSQVLLPIKRQINGKQFISEDTRGILRPGLEHENCDYLVMSFWSKMEAFVMTYTYSGLGTLYRQPRNDKTIFDLWDEALDQLERNQHNMRASPTCLQDAIRSAEWRRELKCYIQILRGLHSATHSRWHDVSQCVMELEKLAQSPLSGIIGVYSIYLSGAYRQGTGELELADSIYRHPVLSLDHDKGVQKACKQAESDVRLLAAFNRVWIMQHEDRRDDQMTNELLEQLRPLCQNHPNQEIRTLWHLVIAATQTNPPLPMTSLKANLSLALNGAKVLGDVQTLSMALNLMRAKLFHDIIGDQALKSAKAGAAQAKRSGNLLWMSVAEGLLAQSYEVQGQQSEARTSWDAAVNYAEQAFQTKTADGH